MDDEPEISWPRLAAFVRQHTHDIRNGLNSLDLETSLLQEIFTDDEGRATVTRVRQQVRRVAEDLRAMSAFFQEPQPYHAPLAVRELMLIWHDQQAAMPEAPAVTWTEYSGEDSVDVDATMMAAIFRELLANARTFREGEPALASAMREGDQIIFELREPKHKAVDTATWGRQLFGSTKRGGYGIGLWNIKRLASANGATITHEYREADGGLITRVSIPVAK